MKVQGPLSHGVPGVIQTWRDGNLERNRRRETGFRVENFGLSL